MALHHGFTRSYWVRKYVDENGLAAMLATKRSVGVSPEVNLRILLQASDKTCTWGNPSLLWNLLQILPEVQNRCISGPVKKNFLLPEYGVYGR